MKPWKISLILLVLISGNAFGENDPADVDRTADSNAHQLSTLPTQAADQRTQQILNSLAKQAGWFPKVKMTVKDGMVTIKGSAKKSQQVDWLVKTAEKLPGVIAVINQANIETPPLTDLTPAREAFRNKIEQTKKYLPLLVFALVLLSIFVVIGIYLSKFTRNLWAAHISNPFLLTTVSRLTMLPIWALFFFLTLKAAGLSALATTIVGGTGAASIILGFAFKGIAENYLSGLLLAIRSPFTLTIAYNDSLNQAIELIQKTLRSIPDVLEKPAPGVYADKLSASGIDLSISYWFDAKKTDGGNLRSALVGQIKDLLVSNGFHIPDVAREIVFSDALRIHLTKSAGDTVGHGQDRSRSLQEKAAEDLKKCKDVPVAKSSEAHDIQNLGENISLLRKTTESDLLEAG